MPELRVDSEINAVLQCIVDAGQLQKGSFSWTGPAVAYGRANISLDASGTVSTLTIESVGQSDEGRYSCSFTGVGTVSTVLNVICKLSDSYTDHVICYKLHTTEVITQT